jgi:hypothetical protein
LRILKAIGAGLTISVCFLYLGCGSIQMANAAHGSNTVPLTIETRLLPSALTGVPYVAALDAIGGTPGYTWAVTSGQLPAGIALTSSTGVISGTPTASGIFSFGIMLTDGASSAEKNVSRTVSIFVAPAPMEMAPTTTLFATNGVAYSQALQVSGGTPSYTWSVASGKLPAGLSLASSTGTISGTPNTSGIVSFDVSVHDSERPARVRSSVVTMDIAPAHLSLVAPAIATATAGSFFSETLQAIGGAPAYRWSIATGSLPSGLTLNSSTGTISGVPSVSGTATFTAMVNDGSNPVQAGSASVTISIAAPPLVIAASALPSVMVATAYSQALQVTGGTAPYRWSISSGQLASGLTLSPAGIISGVPTLSGSLSFTATVSDSSSPMQSASTIRAVTVIPTPLTAIAPVLPLHTIGATYAQSFVASGGTAPYTWRLTSGSLPAGLTLTQSGMVSGVAQASGTSTFTATVNDSSSPGQSASATAGITIAPTALVITSSSLPSVTVGSTYSQALGVSGGTAPYSWTITSGRLPAGLSLTPSSGTITGLTSTVGTSTFTATVTDSSSPAQVTSATASVIVAPTTLSIASTTLAQSTSGTAYVQTLQAIGGTAPYTWSIGSGQLPLGLSLSSSGVISGTPQLNSSSSFAVTVTDSGTPIQMQSASLTITATTPQVVPTAPLSIVSSALSSGTANSSYSQALQATGGTPSYTWSITSGSLPAGLTLAASTGAISGTPSAGGTFNFTVEVSDNSNPGKTSLAATSIVVAPAVTLAGPGTTWFIRTDGGTRYSANVPSGQCDGLADVGYPGTGVNQHCAYNDVRYMWMDGTYGNSAWVMAGGDTLVIRGCAALPSQQNPDAPHCRIGWDKATGNDAQNFWCAGVNAPWGCSMPQPPSGTASQHTRILGGCAYGTYSCNPVIGYPYTSNNLTQLFGGPASGAVMYLYGSQYVDIEGLEITTHNGKCTLVGSVGYPEYCPNSPPYADEAQWGVLTNNQTSNIKLQDVYIHGFTNIGMGGPIGGPFTVTRVIIGFNAFAGWNFDDGHDTPDAAGSSITANYLTVIGNGCLEEYPIVHTQFPAKSCWDSNSGGFGDGLSGQDTELDSFTCLHCGLFYNTKDAFIGPHTQITNLDVENLATAGNMGSELKFAQYLGGTALFQNDLIVENCLRMSEALPGAVQNFNESTGLPGSYLTNYCRAGAESFNYITRLGSSVYFSGNTMIGADAIMIAAGCGYYTTGNVFNFEYDCLPNPNVFTNNNFLGYTDPSLGSGEPPALFYVDPGYPYITITSSYNNEYNIKPNTGDTCGTNHITCIDPLLANEPALPWPGTETGLDRFNALATSNSFYPTSSSPLIGAGTTISGLTEDYYGVVQPASPTIGAVEP